MSGTQADCIGGGYAYVGHGEDCVMVAFSPEVGWWRNSAWFTPDEARLLAERLLQQVEHAENIDSPHGSDGTAPEACTYCGDVWPCDGSDEP